MPRITLPDSSIRTYEGDVTPADVALDISTALARDSLGARIDGVLRDLDTPIHKDAELRLVTIRKGEETPSPDALELLRHSCAHVMAEAVQRHFPDVELVYGPTVERGFYYDLHVPGERGISSDDFEAIESTMQEIIDEDRPFTRSTLSAGEGMAKLETEGSVYKIDNARRAIEAGSDTLNWYATGEPGRDWEDLCRGPHVPNTGRIGAFRLLSVAASFWHGDASSDRLTRLYGTAFAEPGQLARHLEMLEEARRRDHRVLGRQLDLYHIDEAVGPGLVLWTPNGAVVRQALQDFIAGELHSQGYRQVFTPHIGKIGLYRTSGHFPYYQDSQYPPLVEAGQLASMVDEGCSCADLANRISTGDIEGYLLKPMNCPHHVKIYDARPRSYRELPVRLAEFGTVYRWEQSGEVSGMTRVRGFTQDDAHIFCTEAQVADEIRGCLDLVGTIFRTLDMTDYRVRVGLRDDEDDKYVGDPENWAKAEAACLQAAESLGVPFDTERGEAAFYGPKIDFIVRDVVGRSWQLGTVQVDYSLPERFDLSYIGPDNTEHRPVMIHRAPFGSMERFIGVLIEHFAGAFPAWLAPEQVRVLPISEKSDAWADHVLGALLARGLRGGIDHSGERIQVKIREAAMMKIPYLLVVGPRDERAEAVSVRGRGIRKDLGAIPLADFVDALACEVETRGEVTVLDEHFATAKASRD